MNIGIDIDDTLTNFYNYKIKYVKKYLKRNKLPYKVINKSEDYLSKIFDWPEEECIKFWKENGYDLLFNIKPRKNVSKIIDRLKQDGHNVIIVTARSNMVSDDPYTLSKNWLEKNNVKFDKLYVNQQVKLEACKNESVDVFIDDTPAHVIKLQENGIKAVLMQTKGNKNRKLDCEKVKSWKQFYKIVCDMQKSDCK